MPITILAYEDSRDDRESFYQPIRLALGNELELMIVCATKEQFWDKWEQLDEKNNCPNLVMLDVFDERTNDKHGFEICRTIRQNNDWSEVPIIFLSWSSDPENLYLSARPEYRAINYVQKVLGEPALAYLETIVRNALETRPVPEPFVYNLFALYPAGLRVMFNKVAIDFSANEFFLLEILASEPGVAHQIEALPRLLPLNNQGQYLDIRGLSRRVRAKLRIVHEDLVSCVSSPTDGYLQFDRQVVEKITLPL